MMAIYMFILEIKINKQKEQKFLFTQGNVHVFTACLTFVTTFPVQINASHSN